MVGTEHSLGVSGRCPIDVAQCKGLVFHKGLVLGGSQETYVRDLGAVGTGVARGEFLPVDVQVPVSGVGLAVGHLGTGSDVTVGVGGAVVTVDASHTAELSGVVAVMNEIVLTVADECSTGDVVDFGDCVIGRTDHLWVSIHIVSDPGPEGTSGIHIGVLGLILGDLDGGQLAA